MNNIIKLLILVFVGISLALFGWGAEKKEVYKAAVDRNGVQKIEMEGGDFYFKPNDIIVKVNVPVSITIRKGPDFDPHSIVLHAPEAGMDFDVELGKDAKTITFTPTKVGKYHFFCDEGAIITHREKGMEGFLVVTE